MENTEFKYADRAKQTQKINRFLSLAVFLFSLFASGIVVGSYLNGYRSLSFLLTLNTVHISSSPLSNDEKDTSKLV